MYTLRLIPWNTLTSLIKRRFGDEMGWIPKQDYHSTPFCWLSWEPLTVPWGKSWKWLRPNRLTDPRQQSFSSIDRVEFRNNTFTSSLGQRWKWADQIDPVVRLHWSSRVQETQRSHQCGSLVYQMTKSASIAKMGCFEASPPFGINLVCIGCFLYRPSWKNFVEAHAHTLVNLPWSGF